MNIEAQDEEGASWMEPIICYKTKGELPLDEKEAKRKSIRYCLIDGELYKRLFNMLLF